jgi:hypothetical protein
MHSYAGGKQPTRQLDSKWIPQAQVIAGNRSIIATECGYHNLVTKTDLNHQPGVSELAASKYLIRLFFEYFNRGIKRSYTYEMIDLKPDVEANKPNWNYGLLRNDGSRKPDFIALKNLMAILQETSQKVSQPISLQTLQYTITGNTKNIHHTLLQKKEETGDYSWYNTTGKYLAEQEKQYLADSKDPSKSVFLSPNSYGGQNISGYGYAPATRRFNKGGAVNGGSGLKDDIFTRLQRGGYVLNKQAASKIGNSNLNKMASGGMVNVNTYAEGGSVGEGMPEMASVNLNNESSFNKSGAGSAPQVYIKIDINNNGDTSSSSEASGGSKNDTFGEDFAKKLEKQIRNTVKDELVQQDRVGGMNSRLARARQ